MSDRAKTWISILGPVISIILFVFLWLWITPVRDLSAQINEISAKVSDHEARLQVEEAATKTSEAHFLSLESKADQLIRMHLVNGGKP